jgi:hypothetical protein
MVQEVNDKLKFKRISKSAPPIKTYGGAGPWPDMRNFASTEELSHYIMSPVETPSIISPEENTKITSSVFYSSNIVVRPTSYSVTHLSSDWEVATDEDFINIVDSAYNYAFSEVNDWTSSVSGIHEFIYVRVRYQTTAGITSWSKPVKYKLDLPITVPTPSFLVQKAEFSGNENSAANTAILEGTSFDNGGDPSNEHIATEWIVRNNSNNIIYQKVVTTGDLTRLKLPANVINNGESTIQVSMRYIGSKQSSDVYTLPIDVDRRVYDNTFMVLGVQMPEPISGNKVVGLKDDRVLSLGGYNRQSTGVTTVNNYIVTRDGVATPISTPPNGVIFGSISASLLLDGRVLVSSGTNKIGSGISLLPNSYLYNPKYDVWEVLPQMPVPAYGTAQVTLPDGRVMVVGGLLEDGVSTTGAVRIFNPTDDTWTLSLDIENVPVAPINQTVSRSLGLTGSNEVVYYNGYNNESAPGSPTFYKLNTINAPATWDPLTITGWNNDPSDVQLLATTNDYRITIFKTANNMDISFGVNHTASSNIIETNFFSYGVVSSQAGVLPDGTIMVIGGGGSGVAVGSNDGWSKSDILLVLTLNDNEGTTTSPTNNTSTSSFTSETSTQTSF